MELILKAKDERAEYNIGSARVSKELSASMWLRLKFGTE